MIQRLVEARKRQHESGFTLIELLVVIIILGILATVVVSSVGGVNDRGQASACRIDNRTLRTAQEAYFASPNAGNGTYGTEIQLRDRGFLSEESGLHNFEFTPPENRSAFRIVAADGRCA
jgi:prepilin-type N-terminal cleavage/methylation domain-containing protein